MGGGCWCCHCTTTLSTHPPKPYPLFQNVFLMDHLLERHGLHGVRNMRNKAASALARYADEQG